MEIIQLKLHKDLCKLCVDYCPEIDKEWLTEQINGYTKDISFLTETLHCKDTCNARVWDKGRGEKQCTHKKVKGDYCNKHRSMLDTYGVLRFGDITEKKPVYDLIKLQNEYTEKLHWINPNPLLQLQNVLDSQALKIIYTTPTLILK